MRFSPLLSGYFLARALRFRSLTRHPSEDETIRVVGRDPIRVLLTGAGIAAGYGVEAHRHALAGHLARKLAETTGRGVIVQTRTAALMPASRTLQVVGQVGAHTYHAVVFAGCFLEAPHAPNHALSGRIGELVPHLQATGLRNLATVITGLPLPAGTGSLDRAAATATRRSNSWLEAATNHHARTRFVPMPGFDSITNPSPFDHRYYGEAAETIVEDGLAHLLPRVRTS